LIHSCILKLTLRAYHLDIHYKNRTKKVRLGTKKVRLGTKTVRLGTKTVRLRLALRININKDLSIIKLEFHMKKTKSITFRLSEEEQAIIDKRAKNIKRTYRLDRAKVVRKVLLERLDDYDFLKYIGLVE